VTFKNQGVFDELAIDSWFHLEQMDTRQWWLGIGEHGFDITIDKKGKPTLTELCSINSAGQHRY
jgi:hypothetical protein